MNREEWILRCRDRTAGVIAIGAERFRPIIRGELERGARENWSKPELLGEVLNGIGAVTDKLLGSLYDDLASKIREPLQAEIAALKAEIAELKAAKPVNGQPARPVQPARKP